MAEKEEKLYSEPVSEDENRLIDYHLAQSGHPDFQSNEYSTTQSALEAFGRAPAMGFADELAGLAGAGTEMASELVTGHPASISPEGEGKLDRLQRLYNEYKQNLSRREAAQEEQHPVATTVGGLAGGFAVPYGTLGNLQKLSTASKLMKLAKTGAKAGAIMGAGASEASPLEAPVELAEDVAKGAGIGALTGSTLGYAGQKLVRPKETIAAAEKAATSLVEESPLLSQAIESFKRGVAGEKLTGVQTKRKLEKEISNYGEKLFDILNKNRGDLGAARQSLIDEAEKNGIKLDEKALDAWLAKYGNVTSSIASSNPAAMREAGHLEEMIRTGKEGPIVKRIRKEAMPTKMSKMTEIEELKRAEQRAIESGVPSEDIDTVLEPTDVPGKMAAVVRQVTRNEQGQETGFKKLASRLVDEEQLGPQFKEVTETARAGGRDLSSPVQANQLRRDIAQFSKVGQTPYSTNEALGHASTGASELSKMTEAAVPGLEETTAKYGASEDVLKAVGLDKATDPNDARIKLSRLFKDIEENSKSASDAREKLDAMVQQLKISNPKLAEKIGPEISDLSKRHQILSETTKGTGFSVLGGFTIRGGTLAGANIAGRAMKTILDLPPEGLKQLAGKMAASSSKASQYAASALEKIADRPDREKHAMLFSLMQNPAYREAFRQNSPELFEGMDGNE